MTTLVVRVMRPRDRRALVVAGAFAVWLALMVGVRFELVHIGGLWLPLAFGVPLVLVAVALLHRSAIPGLPLAAGGTCAIAFALLAPAIVERHPSLAVGVPALAVGGVVTWRFPTATLAAIFTIAGTYGSIVAFTGLRAVGVDEGLLGGLWAGVVGSLLFGRRHRSVRLTPGLIVLAAFMVMSIGSLLATTPTSQAMHGFRLAPLYLSTALLLPLGRFDDQFTSKLVRIIVPVCLIVSAYATLRWIIGPAAKESALVNSPIARQYNQLAGSGGSKTQGALPDGASLGLWAAIAMPFLTAIALGWRDRTRVAAIVSLPFALIALLASQQRAAAPAAAAGVVLVVVMHILARGFRGPRLGVAAAAAVTMIVAAGVAFPAIMNNPERRQRYANLLTPSQDASFQARLDKWRATLRGLRGHPFGYGLGSGSPQLIPHRFEDVAAYDIDNSYLLIGWEQGLAVMAFFSIALLVLLVELMRHSVWTRGPTSAALASAAAGTLTALIVEFMAADYVTDPPTIAAWFVVGLGLLQTGRVAAQRAEAP